jgi:hypothetical protein
MLGTSELQEVSIQPWEFPVKQKPKSSLDGRAESSKLGTFGGVFTPSVLTILGIILFLRLGFVVGSAGLMKALVIIAIATAISVLTRISRYDKCPMTEKERIP